MKMKRMFKILKYNKSLDDAFAWQELAEKLVEIYKGEYSYTNIIEALSVAEAVFIDQLKENEENEKNS